MNAVQQGLPVPNAVLRGPSGCLLILPVCANAGGLGRFQVFRQHDGAPMSSQIAGKQIVDDIAGDGYGLMSIRELYAIQSGGLISLAPEIIVARLRQDLTDGIMFVAFYIPAWDFTRFVVSKPIDVSALVSDGQGTPLHWSPAQRIVAMLRLVPAGLPPAVQGAWEAVLTPKAVALLSTMLASLPASKATSGGLVDDILLAAAWNFAGWPGLVSLKDFTAAIIGVAGQTRIESIQDDARTAANALLVLGLSFLKAIISRSQDQEKVISLAKAVPPPEPVAPVKPAPVAKGWKDFPVAETPASEEDMPAVVCLLSAASKGAFFVSNV
jgi:hypothetical protein